MLYDLTIRNLTGQQLAALQKVIFNSITFEHEPENDRPVTATITETQINMWDLKIYHLKPSVAAAIFNLLVTNQLYPVILEFKG